MLNVALFFTTFAVLYSGNQLLYKYFDEIFIFSSLCIFPLYYLYLIHLTKDSIHQKKYLWHIAPAAFLLMLYIIFESRLTHKEYEDYILNFIHSRSIINFSPSNPVSQLEIVFLIVRVYYLVQIFLYILLGLRISISWETRLTESLSETTGKEIRLIKTLSMLSFIITIFAYFIDSFGIFFVPESSLILLLPMFLSAPIFFKIGQIGYEQNFTVSDLEEVELEAVKIGSPFTNENPSKIRKNLEILMNEERIYLIPDLRISTVCERLHTNRTYLSQVLNDELKLNFNCYINKYRVEHAILLLKDSTWRNYSLEKFAELSGFGSTISMIRAFKQITGKTPSEFRV